MIKRIYNVLGIKNFIVLLALSVIVVCTGCSGVNKFVNQVLPYRVITITVEQSESSENEVCIFDDGGMYTLFRACKNGDLTEQWEYREANEYGYNGIVTDSNNIGAAISFSAAERPEYYLQFWKQENGGVVTIDVNGKKTYLDLCSDIDDEEILTIYPFANAILPLFLRLAIYGSIIVVCFVVLALGCYWFVIRGLKLPQLLRSYIPKTHFFPLWILLYGYAVTQYKIGIPNFLESGDQTYYWIRSLLNNGRWDPVYLAETQVSFRGYLCHLFPTISKVVGEAFSIDPLYIYFIFTSSSVSWLVAYVLPGLYESLTGQKATYVQVLVSLAVFLFFWNGTLTAVLVDLFGAVAFISGMLFALKFWKEKNLRFAVFVGLFWAIACNYRTAYQYEIMVVCLVAIAYQIMVLLKRSRNRTFGGDIVNSKLFIFGLICALLSFTLVSLPQLQINLAREHTGLLPFDDNNGLARGSSNSIYYTGYPISVTDGHMLSMKTQLYDGSERLTIPQVFSVYTNSPLESLTYIGKKLLMAFDTKTNITYPEGINWRGSIGLIFSFLNYFVLGSAMYIVFKGKRTNNLERVIFLLFFVGLVLPQMFVHVEWRYFLSTYILLYFFFAYHFVGEVFLEPGNSRYLIEENYFSYILTLIFMAFTVSLTIYA